MDNSIPQYRHLGFYDERYPDSGYPTIFLAAKVFEPYEDQAQLLDYLNNGEILVASPGLVNSLIDEESGPIASQSMMTDGTFIWAEEFAHYVEKHLFALPEVFILHIRGNNYQMPVVSDDALMAISETLM